MGTRSTTNLTRLIDAGLLSVGELLHASLSGRYNPIPIHLEAKLVGGEKVLSSPTETMAA
jgi:hypothetical protein